MVASIILYLWLITLSLGPGGRAETREAAGFGTSRRGSGKHNFPRDQKKNAKSWLPLSALSCIFQGHLQERTWSEPSERLDGSMGDQKGEDVGGAVRKVRAGRTRKFSPMPLFPQVGKLRSKEEQGPAQGQE